MAPDRTNENHHYVPQFYLRNWCASDGKMWVYPIENGKPGFRAGPKNFAVEKGLYNTSDVPHLAAHDLEGDFARLEWIFDMRWPDIFNGTIDPETKMNISRFLALMHLRHPKTKEHIRTENEKFLIIAERARAKGLDEIEFVDADGAVISVSVRDVLAAAVDTPLNNKACFLSAITNSIEDLATALSGRKWGVIFNTTEDPVYLTSDTPLIVHRGTCTADVFGFGTPGTEITFPITPTKLLRISDVYDSDGLHYPLIALGDINEKVALTAARFIFSAVELKAPDEA